MPRKNYRSSDAESLFNQIAETSALLPIWITIPIAALLFYFVPFDLNAIVTSNVSNGAMIVVKMFLLAGAKYLIPLALIAGALVHIFQKVKSYFMFDEIKHKGVYETISKLSWQDFEFLLFEWFKKQGYSAELTGGGGADGGVDIKLRKNGELYLVQCKHYKASKVPVTVVRELYGVMTAQGAAGGFIVTSGRFTTESYSFAKKINIELVDRKKLVEILDPVNSIVPQQVTHSAHKCPKCGNHLVERIGKYGKFLGCSTYPKCNFTKAL